MTEHQHDLEQARWEALTDREAIGEALDADERGFVQRYEAAHPELAHERMIFEASIASLRDQLDAEHDPAALDADAAAALERYRSEVGQPGQPRQPDPRAARGSSPGRGWWLAGLAAAAGLLVWVGLEQAGNDDERVGASEAELETPREPAKPEDDRRQPVDARPAPAAPVDPVGRLSMLGEPLEPDALERAPLELGAALGPGVRISDALGGAAGPERACVSWSAPAAVACFEGEVRLTAAPAVGERRLRLTSGRLVAALDPLGPGQRFTVETRLGTVSAIGTVFAVEIHEGRAWVTVLEGRVELRDPTVRALTAGHRTSLRGEVPGDEPTPLQADTIPSALQELVSLAELLRASPGDAALVIPSIPEHSLRLDGYALEGPAQLSLAAGQHALELSPLDPLEPALEPGNQAQTIVLEAGAVEDLGKTLAAAAPNASDPASDPSSGVSRTPSAKRLAQAAQRERELKNYDQTARLYRELLRRYPDSPEAASIPVRLGDLLASTGDHEGALKAYETYLERGAKQLAPEAEFGRIEALRALGRKSEERAAIEAFVAARPDDYRRAQLEARLADSFSPPTAGFDSATDGR